jgi:hypothetical protein
MWAYNLILPICIRFCRGQIRPSPIPASIIVGIPEIGVAGCGAVNFVALPLGEIAREDKNEIVVSGKMLR